MKSETPETDAKEIETRKPIRWSSGYGQTTLEGYVPAEFARKLERERNQLRSELVTLHVAADPTPNSPSAEMACSSYERTPETDAFEAAQHPSCRFPSVLEKMRKMERERNQLRSEMATLKMTAQSTFPEASAPEQISGINTARLVGAGNSSNA